MAVAVTVLLLPTFLLVKVGVPDTVKMSPAMRSSAYVTVALSEALYVLCEAVIDTKSDLGEISAVAVGEPDRVNV